MVIPDKTANDLADCLAAGLLAAFCVFEVVHLSSNAKVKIKKKSFN